jgi:hypothetical protein
MKLENVKLFVCMMTDILFFEKFIIPVLVKQVTASSP